MGKNYDAYQKAVEAENAAKARWSDVQGGSTKETYNEALTNAQQAEAISNEAWQRLMDDPTG
ncbi:hypothetical protein SEA_VORVOLAKOS_50 [Streptomyces phage Vorvolakos]|uniref:Uncharacterized protein n=3 Tax=Flowerpowervirus flowerpower TaxID=2846396 RepID=A0A2U8UNT0_9CAUD|nr:hypothetical protein HWB61_gp51 [Streptomyces phage FlowerPower]QEA11252.1 hypothetical protein SEA_GEOSTIN_45 [Streptomyces phage Geostin]QFP94748.1 hypothetical protein SEA_FABIAN_47 [Streptomyces phage Fabian]QZD97096.1 hypothetical protein SEA_RETRIEVERFEVER_50 [Streptomyces phage RetrieverFever]UOW93263.1 hypothetical protein SEA_VORVOLAKOS_50 [Streptomyces phage Vorvolakos]AWN05131.1 hypothetical protein SEA_FLOWERPOWER_50 [Streptomyces phage FlowerPower]